MTFELPKKDMDKVLDYERRKQLAIFKGQCFNNACTIYSSMTYNIHFHIKEVYDLAQQLYDEGLKRKWI